MLKGIYSFQPASTIPKCERKKQVEEENCGRFGVCRIHTARPTPTPPSSVVKRPPVRVDVRFQRSQLHRIIVSASPVRGEFSV